MDAEAHDGIQKTRCREGPDDRDDPGFGAGILGCDPEQPAAGHVGIDRRGGRDSGEGSDDNADKPGRGAGREHAGGSPDDDEDACLLISSRSGSPPWAATLRCRSSVGRGVT
jgi:hypothetical protein